MPVCCDWQMVTKPGPEAIVYRPGEPLLCSHCQTVTEFAGYAD